MSFDFEDDTINFYKDKKTGEIHEISRDVKEMIMSALHDISKESLKSLRDYLVKNKIVSVEMYQNKHSEIKKFVDTLVDKQVKKIQELLRKIEGEV